MDVKKFTEEYLSIYPDLPEAWVHELVQIAEGKSSEEVAAMRGVTKNAVKQQRKKIFKRINTQDGRSFLISMFHVAVLKLKG